MEEIAVLLCEIMHNVPQLGREKYHDLKVFINENCFSNVHVLRELGETLQKFKPPFERELDNAANVVLALRMGKQRSYTLKLLENVHFMDVRIKLVC